LAKDKLDAASLENLPSGLSSDYQFADLDGDEMSGILVQTAGAWYYKPNLGDGSFGPIERLPVSVAAVDRGRKVSAVTKLRPTKEVLRPRRKS
jgi:hypothetical protein